jgi:DNA repair exonuclease SbcCD ATPase subunit
MKNLFVAISDVHLSLKNLDVSIATLKQSLQKARDLRVPLLIAGDLNDGKAIMRSEWVKALIDLFISYSDVAIHILIGNHDLDNKNSESNSLYFLKTLSNVILYDRPCMMKNVDELDWGIIPYQSNNTDFISCLNKMKQDNVKNLIIHQGILGAYMGDYVVDESSVSPEEFKDFNIVLSGHYHRAQKMSENIYYFGSPFTVNFGESNENKFIYVVSQEQDKIHLQYIETEVRRHVQIEWTKDKLSDAGKLDKITQDCLLKIVIKGTKEFVRGYNLDYFKKVYPQAASIFIVPEIEKQSENRISADIIHSPLKVVDAYLEGSHTDFDKTQLREFLLKTCQDIFSKYTSSNSKSFRIIGIEVENFLSFKTLKYEYKPMGLTLVEGYDEDLAVNTGAGKSTFLDAPVYALFGETSKNLKSDEVLNRNVGKNLYANIKLQSEDGEYTIHRYRRHHQFENDLFITNPSGQEIRGKDNRETQKLIEQIIGCSFEVFLKSTYFTQFGNIDRFLSASDTEKKKLISEITDLSIYDEMQEEVKKVISLEEKTVEKLISEFNQVRYGLDMLKQRKEALQKDYDDWFILHADRLKTLESNYNLFETNRLAEIEDYKKKQAQHLVDQSLKVHNLEMLSSKWEEDLTNKIRENQDKIHFNNGCIAEEEFKIDELKKLPIINIVDEKKKIQDKLDIVRQLEDKFVRLGATRDVKKSSRTSLFNKINAEVDKLNNNLDSDCQFCHQKVSGPHIQKHIDDMNELLKQADIEILDLNTQMNNITNSIAIKTKLQQDLKDVEAKEKAQYEISYKISIHNRSIENLKAQNLDLSNQNVTTQVNPYKDQIELAKVPFKGYESSIYSLENKENPYKNQIESHKKEQNPHSNGFVDLENKIKDEEKKLYSIESIKSSSSKNLQVAQWWKQAIHVYIKSYLMDSCLENINTIANEYLQTLFDGVLKFDISATTEKGSEIKEKINVSIINNGDECSYQSLSGGERCRICLAVNLSLAEVIAKSGGKSFNMIFLDEIFNGLDESGKAQSMKLLKDLERKYESIFVIDHAEGFKSLFTNSIMIKKKNKLSAIV